MFHMIEKFVDSPSVVSCQWDSEDPRYNEWFLRHDMENQLDFPYNGQRPIWVLESTNTETGEIAASFHRDNPGAAFGWSENLMELIRRFAAKKEQEESITMNEITMNENLNIPETTTSFAADGDSTPTPETTTEPEPERVQVGTCADCGEPIYEDDEYFNREDGELVCGSCYNSGNYVTCEDCGSVVDADNATFIHTSRHYHDDGYYLCSACTEREDDRGNIFECDECHEYWIEAYVNTDDNGNHICDNCFEDEYERCNECGDIIHRDDAEYDDDSGYYYCQYCWERSQRYRRPRTGTLYSYHGYDMPSQWYGDSQVGENLIDRAMYLGTELETDQGEAVGPYVDELCEKYPDEEYFVCAHDGSLEDGVELVMQPATLEYHLTEFPWEGITEIARRHGFRSHDTSTCGLHVHVSRNAMGDDEHEQDLTAAKIALLFDRHWTKIVRFSRRNRFSYCNKLNTEITDHDTEYDAISKSKDKACGHGRALNLENLHTVEFRIFRGTLNVNTIKATLEFVSNMVWFCKEHSLNEVMGCDFVDYALYKRYPELDTYLRQRSLMPAQMDEEPTCDGDD